MKESLGKSLVRWQKTEGDNDDPLVSNQKKLPLRKKRLMKILETDTTDRYYTPKKRETRTTHKHPEEICDEDG